MEEKRETLDEMLSRHRKEIFQLQVKEARTNQATLKKLVEDAFLSLLPVLKEMYADEIASLGYKSCSSFTEDEERSNLTPLLNAVGFSVNGQADQSEPSKSVEIQNRFQREEAEREQRIKQELRCLIRGKLMENEDLAKKIEPLGLTVKEIECDRHCLYRAVEDQLRVLSGGASHYGYQGLRELAVAYMRQHASHFLHFYRPVDAEIAKSDVSHSEKFEKYCKKVESAAVLGGLLELTALAHCLKKHIKIFAGFHPDREVGKEYKSDEGSIFLAYHVASCRLPPHYTSLVPCFQKKQIIKLQQVKEARLNRAAFKKLVENVFLSLLPVLKEMYADEIASLGYKSCSSLTEDEERSNLTPLLNAVGVSITGQADQSEPSKSGKKIQKRVQQEEAERELRIKQELCCLIRAKLIEDKDLAKKIEPFGLTVKVIKRDGHCMYRAVEDQLRVHSQESSHYGYQELRKLAVAYMRQHASDFLPMFRPVGAEIAKSDVSHSEKFEKYCETVESTAVLGGRLELKALAHCLKKHIKIFAGFRPDREVGEEYKSGEGSIFLSYHVAACRLPAHYNSLVPCFQK